VRRLEADENGHAYGESGDATASHVVFVDAESNQRYWWNTIFDGDSDVERSGAVGRRSRFAFEQQHDGGAEFQRARPLQRARRLLVSR